VWRSGPVTVALIAMGYDRGWPTTLTYARAMRRTRVFRQTQPWFVDLALAWLHKLVIEERMANTASARKRIRQTVTRTARNQARKSRMRTFVKKVETAIASGDKSAAAVALRDAQPEMQRASGKGVIHANTVARKLSRLSARIKALPSA
jgi:small subunit ribosomal protein S20